MSVEAFEAQLDFLDRSGYKVISIEDLTRSLDARQNPPEKAVVLAIDDGWSSFMRVFPILAKRNLPFTLFLPMAFVANPYSKSTLSQADIETLRAYPKATFANHSWLHSPKVAGNETLALEDIRKSVARFRQVFGCDTKYFAFPYGKVTATYTRLLREAGFQYLFVTGSNPPTADTDPSAIPRIAANRLSLPVLASVLRNHEAMLARAKARPTPPVGGPCSPRPMPAQCSHFGGIVLGGGGQPAGIMKQIVPRSGGVFCARSTDGGNDLPGRFAFSGQPHCGAPGTLRSRHPRHLLGQFR
jgi:peptidoglycan/xylan/chitin deacetylase (PgdA/CDA1 family)